eukprot:6180799-Pleurochrysis_carterae.AAC.2
MNVQLSEIRTVGRAVRAMPFVQVTWLPKAARTAEVRKQVADAIIKAMVGVKEAEISPQNLVRTLSEAMLQLCFHLPERLKQLRVLHAEKFVYTAFQVVRFGESVDGFPLPKGYSENPELQAPVKK